MKSLVRAGLAAALALIVAMFGGAKAADEPVSIRLIPDAVSLQPGLSNQEVALIAKLPAKTTARSAKLSWVKSPGVDIRRLAEPTFPATSDLVWKLSIAAQPGIAKDTVIGFVLEYELKAEGDAPAQSAVSTAKMQVTYAGLSLPQSLKVSLEHGFTSLTPEIAAGAFLVIDNSGAEDVTLQAVVANEPGYLEVRACPKGKDGKETSCGALPRTIPGRSIIRVPVEIEATRAIPPGTLHLLLNLTFSRGSGAAQEKATISVLDKVEAGIPGLSEIKTALQIPSFFFLPGVLVVLTMGFIWAIAHRGENAPAYIPSAREGHFYLISISFSLAIAWGYSRWYLKEKKGLLEAISLVDVAIIWFGSIVLGLLLYGLIALIKPSVVLAKRLYSLAVDPRPTDSKRAILRKIAWQGKRLQLQTFMAGPAGNQQRVFDLGFGAPDEQHAWVVSRIMLNLAPGAAGLEPELSGLIANDDLQGLRRFLRREAGNYDADWGGEAPFDRPALVERATFGAPLGRQGVVGIV